MKNRIWTCLNCGKRTKHVELDISPEIRREFNDKVSVKQVERYAWKCTNCGDSGEQTEFEPIGQEE
jgi:ribosomal protein L37AE/L43A